ncbi:MAG: hypothetical protein K2X90_01190 [Candidatus Babeliaceae bacterium]|nr:hypothetical protein [Candidatus Babeliaceae bacterium]
MFFAGAVLTGLGILSSGFYGHYQARAWQETAINYFQKLTEATIKVNQADKSPGWEEVEHVQNINGRLAEKLKKEGEELLKNRPSALVLGIFGSRAIASEDFNNQLRQNYGRVASAATIFQVYAARRLLACTNKTQRELLMERLNGFKAPLDELDLQQPD